MREASIRASGTKIDTHIGPDRLTKNNVHGFAGAFAGLFAKKPETNSTEAPDRWELHASRADSMDPWIDCVAKCSKEWV